MPKLKIIARHGIGFDNVDTEAASEQGVAVTRVPGPIERAAVAEHAIALLLGVGRRLVEGSQAVRESKWADRAEFIGIELYKKKIGVIGLGNIGSHAAQILSRGFQAEVLGYDPYLDEETIRSYGADPTALDKLLSSSDVLLLHCALTEQTRGLIDASRVRSLKKGVVIVNTARGELVDEVALSKALFDGTVRAYATDVVTGEPIDNTHPLLKAPNVLIVPHLGGYTYESVRGMGETMVQQVREVLVERKIPDECVNAQALS